jgi:hypothetical protein
VFEEVAASWKIWADKLIDGEANDNRQCEEVRSSELFVHDSVGEILQRAV